MQIKIIDDNGNELDFKAIDIHPRQVWVFGGETVMTALDLEKLRRRIQETFAKHGIEPPFMLYLPDKTTLSIHQAEQVLRQLATIVQNGMKAATHILTHETSTEPLIRTDERNIFEEIFPQLFTEDKPKDREEILRYMLGALRARRPDLFSHEHQKPDNGDTATDQEQKRE